MMALSGDRARYRDRAHLFPRRKFLELKEAELVAAPTTSVATSESTTPAGLLGPCLVHFDRAALQLFAIQTLDGRGSVFIRHFNKAKSPRLVRCPIHYDPRGFNVAILSKCLF